MPVSQLRKIVIPLEFADATGGMLHSVELLIRYLVHHVSCVVIAPRGSTTARRMSYAGAAVIETAGMDSWPLSRRMPIQSCNTFRRVRRVLDRVLDDRCLLFTNNIGSELICGLGTPFPKIPRVYANRGNKYGGMSLHLLRRSVKAVHCVVATTPYQREVAIEQMGVAPGRICIIPNAVDDSLLQDAQVIPPPWSERHCINIGVVGYPSPAKNQQLLVQAIALLRRERLPVVGYIIGSPGTEADKRYLKYLHDLVDDLDLRDGIRFVPYEADKRAIYTGIDVLVSTSKQEGFGRTIIEAMAAKRPVIALRAGGPECIIEHGVTGLLLDKGDPALLASSIASIIRNREMTAGMLERASALVKERYMAPTIAARYLAIFQEVWKCR